MRSEKEIAIETCIPDGLAAEADRGHLSNVLHNLPDNAVKYSGDSVRISIKAGSEGISVADDGIGIPAKALPTSSTSSTGCLTATARTCADMASASSMSAAYWRRWDGPSA